MNKEICDEEFNKYFKEETNKQTFKIKMEEPMKLIINYDYYFLLLKKLERLESKIKMLEKYKDDYKRMKDNFDSKVDVIENLHKEIDRLNNKINELEEYIKPYLYMLNGIQDRDIYEQCQLDDFTDIMEKLQELKEE